MALWRRLDRSMPCLSSPLSRVASALLAFLHGGGAHFVLSPHIDGCAPSAAREMRCSQIDSNKVHLQEAVLISLQAHQKWSALSSAGAVSPGLTAGGASSRAVTAYTTSAAYSCGPVPSSSLKLLQDRQGRVRALDFH